MVDRSWACPSSARCRVDRGRRPGVPSLQLAHVSDGTGGTQRLLQANLDQLVTGAVSVSVSDVANMARHCATPFARPPVPPSWLTSGCCMTMCRRHVEVMDEAPWMAPPPSRPCQASCGAVVMPVGRNSQRCCVRGWLLFDATPSLVSIVSS